MSTNDVLVNALTEKIVSAASEANSRADKVRAAKGDNPETVAKRHATKTDIAEVPENVRETVANFRAMRDKVQAKLDADASKLHDYLVANLATSNLDEATLKTLTDEYHSHRDQFKTFRKSLVDLDIASDEQISALPSVKTLGGGSRSNGSNASAGRPKPRFDDITVGGKSVAVTNSDGKRVVTPTVTAALLNSLNSDNEKWEKVASSELVDAYLAAADGDTESPVSLKSFRGEYDIVFTPKDKNV